MPKPEEVCENCKWSKEVGCSGERECHLHPPVLDVMHSPEHSCAWHFPIVGSMEPACGDFKKA